MFSIKKITAGSIIAYSITFAFLALAVFFTLSASSQDQAFISSELGLATFSPNGPAGGMLVAASGCSSNEGGGYCHPPPPPVLGNWSTGGWGSCSGSCGTSGTQYRSVTCSNSNGCKGSRPASSRGCNNASCPTPTLGTWSTGSWGSCSGACGTSGTQTRSVRCYNSNGCYGSRPASSRSCNNASCSTPTPGTWSTGSWSSCSGSCGTNGTQYRSVTCSGSSCSGTRPASSRSCSNAACPVPLGTWSTGSWSSCSGACGTTGSQYRSVTCSSSSGCSGSRPASSRSCSNAACPPPPPTVTFGIKISPPSTTYSSSQIFVAPDDDLQLIWNSSNASSCSTNFGGSGTSGSRNEVPNLKPGGSRNYQVTCSNSIGETSSRTITARVPNILIDTFVIDPSLVRSGETATIQWKLELDNSLTRTPSSDFTPFSYSCEINGAVENSPYSFNASTNNGSGSIETRALEYKYSSVLHCDTAVRGETSVEVIPTTEEI